MGMRTWPRAGRAGQAGQAGRRAAAWRSWRGPLAAVLAPAALTAVLEHLSSGLNLTSTVLLFLAAVVAVARLGGMFSALAAALWASLLLNYYFVFPLHSAAIADANDAIALAVFVVVALTVASVVDLAARQSRRAARANAEAATLNAVALAVLRGDGALGALLDQLRATFEAASVSLLQRPEPAPAGQVAAAAAAPPVRSVSTTPPTSSLSPTSPASSVSTTPPASPASPASSVSPGLTAASSTSSPSSPSSASSTPPVSSTPTAPRWHAVAVSGAEPPEDPEHADSVVPVEPGALLALRGRVLAASDAQVLSAFTAQATAALERRRLAQSAAETASLQAADRMRTALLAAVSHDLRSPLSAARAAVNTLADPELALAGEDRAELLEIAEQSLARLTNLVEDLLDMSRLQAGALKPRLVPLDAYEVLGPALESLPEGRERVLVEPPPERDAPQILADGPLLERVVANLLANAIKHTDSAVSVSVSVSASTSGSLAASVTGAARPGEGEDEGDGEGGGESRSAVEAGREAQIRVADHGPGIPVAARELVFRPFQRLGDRDNTAGVGLGLALARGLTESMGGTLTPEDTPGGGLTMVLTLPIAPEPAGDADDDDGDVDDAYGDDGDVDDAYGDDGDVYGGDGDVYGGDGDDGDAEGDGSRAVDGGEPRD